MQLQTHLANRYMHNIELYWLADEDAKTEPGLECVPEQALKPKRVEDKNRVVPTLYNKGPQVPVIKRKKTPP